MGRGQLTDDIQLKAEHYFDRQITKAELRLMPYVDYVMKNEQRIDPRKCNQEDRDVLRLWKDAGYIEGGAGGLSITREFYDIIQDFLWLAYVAYES